MLLYLWLANFLFSLIILTPFYFLISNDFSRSMMQDQMVKGFELLWLGDLVYKYQNIFPAIFGWMLVPGIFFLLLYIFLNGGIIGRICALQEEKINLGNFFADCGKYFLRFLRVFLISILAYIIVFGIGARVISALFSLWTKGASSEWPLLVSSNLKLLVFILLFSIARMFFDYVKISLVVEKSRKTVKATISTLPFIGRNFFKAWLLYLGVGLIAVLFGLFFLGIAKLMPRASLILVFIFFLIEQLYILSRMWTKILFFSTEYHFFWLRKIS